MADAIAVEAAPTQTGSAYPQRWIALAAIVAAETMDLVDAQVTNVAGPAIRSHLNGGTSLIQWLGASYTLAMAVGLITGGRLGDLYGRARVFLVGMVGFIIGSVLCAVSQSTDMIIVARIVQGLFGALMLPQSFGLLRQMFSGAEMTAAIGAIGPIMALSTVGAPVLSGALIGWDIWGTSWRMIFLINIPLGLIGLAVAAVYLPKSQALKDEKLDVVGVVLAALAGGLLIYPLVQGRELGWPAWIFVLLAAAVAMSVIFVLYERRLEDRGGHPLLPRSLFQNRGFSAGLAMAVVYFSAFVAFALVFTLFVQLGLGYSPARAGIANMAPALAAVVAFGIVSGAELPQKNGRLVIQIGALVCVLGSIAVFITLKAAGTDVTLWKLTPSLAVTGLGLGLVFAPFFDIATAAVDEKAVGSAGGTLTAGQQLGSAIGVAVLGTIFFGALAGHVTTSARTEAPNLRAALTAAAVPASPRELIVTGLGSCAHDTAKEKDPSIVPASCQGLQAETARAAAASRHPAAVASAVVRAEKRVRLRGFSDVFQISMLVLAGVFAVTFLLAFALPIRARPLET